MDPAQSENLASETYPVDGGPPQEPPVEELPPSPFKKFIPFIIVGTVLLILLSGVLVLSIGKSSTRNIVPTPSPRPTATPFPAPTIPLVTKPATSSAEVKIPAKIGRLSFIKDGDIYNSDLASFSLLVKNATPAGDRLSWSPKGNFLTWREADKTATPASMVVYDRLNKKSYRITGDKAGAELIDYTWEPNEEMLAVLFWNEAFNISLFSPTQSSPPAILLKKNIPIKQILWPKKESLIYLDNEGISEVSLADSSVQTMVATPSAIVMKFSPDNKKLLYSVGDSKKSDLYILDLETGGNTLIPPIPGKVDMGTTGASISVLNNGFIPYAVFMPKGDSLLVGYYFLQYMPLVGIYNLKENSFSAVAPFPLFSSDTMVDELRLLGARVVNIGEKPSWQISLFTLEDNAKLGLIRVIPHASSPTFFGQDILPAENSF